MPSLVTAANRAYLPGVRALRNSLQRHSPGWDLSLLYDGPADDVANLQDVRVILNPALGARRIPVTRNRPVTTAAVHFYRILAPALFGGERVIYLDCDAIVLQPLEVLLDWRFDQTIAASRSSSTLDREIEGGPVETGFISSLMLIDVERWQRNRIFEKCIALMNAEPDRFFTGDQAVLNTVLYKDWHELPWHLQAHAGHTTFQDYPREQILILHFLGTKPWMPVPAELQPYPAHKLAARALWATYA